MKIEEIRKVLTTAPSSGDPQRIHYFGSYFGQMFGWITQPDTFFLVDWLPEMGLSYKKTPLDIVEVGTFAGSTARGLITLTGGSNIKCIDNFFDMNPGTLNGHPDGQSYWNHILKTAGPDLSNFATLIVGNSYDVGETWNTSIDLLFVDGDHSYQAAKNDITLFAKHVVPGGYCMVDDYHMPDVTKAVDEYFMNEKWELVRMPDKNPASIIVFKKI